MRQSSLEGSQQEYLKREKMHVSEIKKKKIKSKKEHFSFFFRSVGPIYILFVTVEIVDGRLELNWFDHFPCPQRIQVSTAVRGACPENDKQSECQSLNAVLNLTLIKLKSSRPIWWMITPYLNRHFGWISIEQTYTHTPPKSERIFCENVGSEHQTTRQ